MLGPFYYASATVGTTSQDDGISPALKGSYRAIEPNKFLIRIQGYAKVFASLPEGLDRVA
jgi:hypothetical protein